MTAEQNRLYRRAYALLKKETPLGRFDCGRLCGGACCKGTENDGMLLFPHEEELLAHCGYTITAAGEGCAMVCGGTCKRDYRPLACRFFPLFPVITVKNGSPTVAAVRDPRAAGACPLGKGGALSPRFVRAVRRAGKILARDDEIRAYMENMSEELAEITALQRMLIKED